MPSENAPPALPNAHRVDYSLVLEAPRRANAMIIGRLAPLFLDDERRLYVADGVNSFDPYVFAAEARRHGLPDDVMDRVMITRVFTIHQLAAVTERMLMPLRNNPAKPTVVVLGLDHLFLEQSLRVRERARVLAQVIEGLELIRQSHTPIVATHERPPREPWWKPLLTFGDVRGRVLTRNGKDNWKCEIEKCKGGEEAAYIRYLTLQETKGLPEIARGGSELFIDGEWRNVV